MVHGTIEHNLFIATQAFSFYMSAENDVMLNLPSSAECANLHERLQFYSTIYKRSSSSCWGRSCIDEKQIMKGLQPQGMISIANREELGKDGGGANTKVYNIPCM